MDVSIGPNSNTCAYRQTESESEAGRCIEDGEYIIIYELEQY